MKIRDLNWVQRVDDNVIHADPEGLIKSYYIYPPHTQNNQSNHFELALISDKGEFSDQNTSTHSNLENAKSYAQQHYENIVSKHIIN